MLGMMQVPLRNVGEFLGLQVPGLSEGRPSVLIGDKVIISVPGQIHASEGPEYEGYVHEVNSNFILSLT